MQTQVSAGVSEMSSKTESAELPEMVKFERQVEINRTIEGIYPVAKLARLSETLFSNDGHVTAKLEFTDSVGFASLKGKVSAKILVECQRCLEPVETEISGSFKFALINSEEEIEQLPEEFEPYLVEGDEQSIVELIEDELLLCLPMVTIHDQNCSDYMTRQNSKIKAEMEADKEAARKAEHPFAALKALKEDKDNKIN